MGFWPIILFYKLVEFDPAKFTEEWIKTFFSAVVIGLLLKYYDMIMVKRLHANQLISLKNKIILSIDDLIIEDKINIKDLSSIIYYCKKLSIEENYHDLDIDFILSYYNNLHSPLITLSHEDTIKCIEKLKLLKELLQ